MVLETQLKGKAPEHPEGKEQLIKAVRGELGRC